MRPYLEHFKYTDPFLLAIENYTMNLSVIGLGKLGLPLACCLAEAGHRVLGIDLEPVLVDKINRGESPLFEPQVQELVQKHHAVTLQATTNISQAVTQTDATFILVATPSRADGSFSNEFIEAALRSLGQCLRKNPKSYHLFIISSTVVPGSTLTKFLPILEAESGKKAGRDFGLAYDPDFVALGTVVHDFQNPDLVVLGAIDTRSGDMVEEIHKTICKSQPKISRMGIQDAELAKVCLNAFITVKISFANSVAQICEKIPGTNCDAVTKGIGADRRISPHYFTGGASFGGTCFPRDTVALKKIAADLGLDAPLMAAVEKINKEMDLALADRVQSYVPVGGRVGIIGLSFKDGTSVIAESNGIKLARILLERGVRVTGYDPIAGGAAVDYFGPHFQTAQSLDDLMNECDVVAMMVRSPVFRNGIESFRKSKKLVIIDLWRFLDRSKLSPSLVYVPVGVGAPTA